MQLDAMKSRSTKPSIDYSFDLNYLPHQKVYEFIERWGKQNSFEINSQHRIHRSSSPLGVAAGQIDKLRESRHGWRASFRMCRDASFGSDSKFGYEHKGLSTPLGRLGESKEDRTSSPPWSGVG